MVPLRPRQMAHGVDDHQRALPRGGLVGPADSSRPLSRQSGNLLLEPPLDRRVASRTPSRAVPSSSSLVCRLGVGQNLLRDRRRRKPRSRFCASPARKLACRARKRGRRRWTGGGESLLKISTEALSLAEAGRSDHRGRDAHAVTARSARDRGPVVRQRPCRRSAAPGRPARPQARRPALRTALLGSTRHQGARPRRRQRL